MFLLGTDNLVIKEGNLGYDELFIRTVYETVL